MLLLRVVVVVFIGLTGLTVAGCGGEKSNPVTPTPTPTPPTPVTVTLTAPAHATPADDAQTDTLLPTLAVLNATSTPSGLRTYDFEVSPDDQFAVIAVSAENVPEGAGGQTTWTATRALQATTRYWWRARARQASTTGPWSTKTRFRSRVEGYNRPGELFDPLTNGSTVGEPINVSFPAGQGVKLDTLGSRVMYRLEQSLPAGEFSLLATGLNSNSAGDSTKLFSMQQGSADIRQNLYRATIEKRDHGIVTFRFIAGDLDARADAERIELQFDPSVLYFWKFTWGNGFARLVVREGGENGREVYNRGDNYSGIYRPSPHIAHLGVPVGGSGINAASVPGAVIRNVWLSSRPRPSGLGSPSIVE